MYDPLGNVKLRDSSEGSSLHYRTLKEALSVFVGKNVAQPYIDLS